jgi:hypothetical protein
MMEKEVGIQRKTLKELCPTAPPNAIDLIKNMQ